MELIATGMSAETKKKRHELAKALKVRILLPYFVEQSRLLWEFSLT